VLKDQLLVRSLSGYGAVLPKEIDDTVFAFYGTTLSGTPQQEERWKRGVTFATDALSDDISKIYVQRHFPARDEGRRRRAREERRRRPWDAGSTS
jgi:putative endopeptidase